MTKIDKIFTQNQVGLGEFSFDRAVADVFDDMITRSVPLYRDVHDAIPVLADRLEHEQVTIVDLGCSTGASLAPLAQLGKTRGWRLVGVDNSQPMLDRCREKLQELGLESNVELIDADLREVPLEDPSIVLMNYTMQFVPLDERPTLLRRIQQSLRPGGFLLLSEKLAHRNSSRESAWRELYYEFKRRNGYSDLEISRKRDALENVLVPLPLEDNLSMLKGAGFSEIELVLKWFNFATILATQ